MPTESDNFKFLLFFYPISSHDFLRMGLSIGWGVVLCNELSVHVVQMVIALNHKEHVYTRGRHHKIVLFVLYNERLSSARSIFRNDFALEFWRPLTSTYFELDFVYHVPKVPSFPFPTVKDPNFCKDLAQQHFQKQRPLPRNLFSFWSYILFRWMSKWVSQFLRPGRGESPALETMVACRDNF